MGHEIVHLEKELTPLQNDQTRRDLETVKKSYQNFIINYQDLQKKLEENQNIPLEEWLRIRHDLRDYIATMKGYCELIHEDLRLSKTTKTFKVLTGLMQLCDDLLPQLSILGAKGSPLGLEKDEAFFPTVTPSYKGRILIVDDNPQKQEPLFRRLKQAGHHVLTTNNGVDALKLIEDDKIDLILLDIMMPEMNGYEVLKKLKSQKISVHIPVLVISSISDLDSVVRCIRIGADDYLPTPVNPILLHARVNACLDKKVLRDREEEIFNQLTKERQRLQAAIESIESGFAIFDDEDRLIDCNETFKKLYPSVVTLGYKGFTYQQFIEMNIQQNIYQKERRKAYESEEEDPKKLVNKLLKYHQNLPSSYEQLLTSGDWLEITESKIPSGGYVSLHKNITVRKEREEKIKYLADHDPLTGLINRMHFKKLLSSLIENATNTKKQFALFYIDLDGFKNINDTYGHEVGDIALKECAKRIESSLRHQDIITRIGGDEFCVIIPEIVSKEKTEEIAQRIFKEINEALVIDNHTITFGISMGIAIFPDNGQTADDLIRQADHAMYAAKRAGKGHYLFVPV
jgi:diguanylate cyclase (GGDEF)-like protein